MPINKETEKKLVEAAREAIWAHLQGKRWSPKAPMRPKQDWATSPHDGDPTGIFITLYTKNNKTGAHELRGCIGRHCRLYDNLEDEVGECALQSAFEDDRFAPVSLKEFDGIDLEISLLNPAEMVHSLQELDPKIYGVIVRAGGRSATLLPDIEGVDTVKEQLSIVRRKAGIGPGEAVQISKFSVQKIKGF